MFYGCESLPEINFSKFDGEKLKEQKDMLYREFINDYYKKNNKEFSVKILTQYILNPKKVKTKFLNPSQLLITCKKIINPFGKNFNEKITPKKNEI